MPAPPPDQPLERQLHDLTAVHQSLRALTSTLELPAILRAVLDGIKTFTAAEGLSLLLYDRERDELVFSATETLQESALLGLPATGGPSAAGWAACTGESTLAEDERVLAVPPRHRAPPIAGRDPRHHAGLAERTGLVPRSMLCVPMVKKNALLGVIQVINKLDGSCFTDGELRLVETLADHAAIAIENASLYREAQLAAITDDLTGLGNTRHFNRMLPELLARGGPLSLLVLDLDNFKALVDSEGHLVGSRTIGFVGRMIARQLRPGDLAARFGGDEFVVILPGADAATARRVAESMRNDITRARVIASSEVEDSV